MSAQSKIDYYSREIQFLRDLLQGLEERLRVDLGKLEGAAPPECLYERLTNLERRVDSIESAGQKLGPTPSNPIPGAWPWVSAPVCAVCCGPHQTGNCVR